MVPRPPIPSQDVNDRSTEDSVGAHTNATSSSVGTPHISVRTSLSRADSWRRARLRRPRRRRAGSVTTVISRVVSGREDRLLLVLDLLRDPVDVVGVADERLQR